jgi:phosphoribosyl-AMP cyclohydrolase
MVESVRFASRAGIADIEETGEFAPRLDAAGLIPAIAVDAAKGGVLMVAWMNAEALALTLETGSAHFFSRSRQRLWRKGETSGEALSVVRVLTDCDQDVILLEVRPEGRGAACHTGRRTCFYREVVSEGGSHRLVSTGDAPLFDPARVYRQDGEDDA